MKKQFINIKDLQTTGWAVGCYGTLIQWRKKAMEWADMDGNYGVYNLLKYYKIKNNELIDFINEFWEIYIVEYDKNKNYDKFFDKEDLCELDY